MIAVMYEGERAERMIFENIKSLFWQDNEELVVVAFPYGNHIYTLYNALIEEYSDVGEGRAAVDLIALAKDKNSKAREILEKYSVEDFSEIYLFLDYDCQAQSKTSGASDDVVADMLRWFSDASGIGKLYINYPMVESLRDIGKDTPCFSNCFVAIENVKDYKQRVHLRRDFQDCTKYDRLCWNRFCRHALSKANCIVNDKYSLPSYEELSSLVQEEIFKNHCSKYVKAGHVVILNSIPLFLLEFMTEFYGESYWTKFISDTDV